jgi:hypothetical protein
MSAVDEIVKRFAPLLGTINEAAREATVSSQLPGRENGLADAYRHLLWGAELTRVYGPDLAGAIMSFNESREFYESKAERAMDNYNNAVAVQIGKSAKSWQDVQARAQLLMQKTFADQSLDHLCAPHWKTTPEGNLTRDGLADLGEELVVAKPSLLSPKHWRKNPIVHDTRVSDEQANWPDADGKWLLKFTPNTNPYKGSDTAVAGTTITMLNLLTAAELASQSLYQGTAPLYSVGPLLPPHTPKSR